ncbi:MAG: hypothetical protein PHP44_12525 [Kiritimatiellae bacterium]|nr:hypothetical protein [Kiritimatiellia bacterium]
MNKWTIYFDVVNDDNGAIYASYDFYAMTNLVEQLWVLNSSSYAGKADMMTSNFNITISGDVSDGWFGTFGTNGEVNLNNIGGRIDRDYDGWYATNQNPNQSVMFVSIDLADSLFSTNEYSLVMESTQTDDMGIAHNGLGTWYASAYEYTLVRHSGPAGLLVLSSHEVSITNGSVASVGLDTDFGSVTVGMMVSNQFAITNGGGTNLVISWSGVDGNDAFVLSGMPSVVDAGTVSNFWISFDASTVGVYRAEIVLTNSSADGEYRFGVAGEAVKREQVISWGVISNQWTTNETEMVATASSGLDVVFEVVEGAGSLTDRTDRTYLTYSDAGEMVVRALQTGNVEWAAAPVVTQRFEVRDVIWTVQVVSAYGSCVPGVGSYVWTNGDVFLGWVTNGRVQLGDPLGGTQYVYTGWSGSGSAGGGGSETGVSFTVTEDSQLVWNWGTNYRLSASAVEHGWVNVTQAWVGAGSTTQITAVADEYYAFTNWSGGASGSANPVSLLMDGAKSIMAEFTALVATSNVPQWWLAQYGFTNDFDAACAADQDGDGYLTWQEWVCGTVPTNGASRFVFGVESGNGSMVFSWDPAVSGRVYAVEDTQELLNGFTNVAVVLSNRVNCWTGSTDVGNAFYRVRVEE